MKKFFQNLALASLVITGILVSSCQVEDIQTTFEPSNAVATITVTVIDASHANADVSHSSDLRLEASSTANCIIKISGNELTIEGGPALQKQDVTITAFYEDLSGKTTKTVNSLLAGGKASYDATILVGTAPSPSGAKYFAIEQGIEIKDVKVGTFTSSHGLHTYTHDYSHATTGYGFGEGKWLYNESEFILKTSVVYENEHGTIGVSTEFAEGHTVEDMKNVMYYSEALYGKKAVKESEPYEIKVSAFAMYSAFCTKTSLCTTYDIIRREEGKDDFIAGKVRVITVETQIEYCEAAIPGHEGHYHYGHGHDDIHGYSSNAGGGIVFAD